MIYTGSGEYNLQASDVAFCIKSFLREDKLFCLVESIFLYYPVAHIYIVDDGPLSEKKLRMFAYWESKGVKTILAPFDSGLSFGRNLLVESCVEPFVLMLEDDFVFTEKTRIEILVEILLQRPDISVVGGGVVQGGHLASYDGKFELVGGVLTYLVEKNRNWDEEDYRFRWRYVDRVFNFFLAHRGVLQSVKWNPKLKIQEHIAFFIDYKSAGKCLVYTDSVSILHEKSCSGEYAVFRCRDRQYSAIFKELYSILEVRSRETTVPDIRSKRLIKSDS